LLCFVYAAVYTDITILAIYFCDKSRTNNLYEEAAKTSLITGQQTYNIKTCILKTFHGS